MKNIYFVLSLVCFITCIILLGILPIKQLNPEYNSVPIQSYDEVINQLHYAKTISMAQSIIINDLLTKGEIDTSFINKINYHVSINKIDDQKIINDKQIIVNQIDSIYHKWLLSIPFMFGDDSTKVLESDSYKRILELIKNK